MRCVKLSKRPTSRDTNLYIDLLLLSIFIYLFFLRHMYKVVFYLIRAWYRRYMELHVICIRRKYRARTIFNNVLYNSWTLPVNTNRW